MADDDPTAVFGVGSGGSGQGRQPRRQVIVGPATGAPPSGRPSKPQPPASGRSAGAAAVGAGARPLQSPGDGPAALPPPADATRGRRRRFRPRVVVPVALVLLVAVVVAPLVFAWWQFSRIERVDVGAVLTPATGGTNYLVVGSDSRELVDPSAPEAGAFLAGPAAGQRADTIIVVRVGDGPVRMMSIPRDLWVTYPTTGEEGRINGAFGQGPAELIATVRSIGIPVDHYLQIDFTSFGGLVDAVGGIVVDFPNPAFDEMSGLAVETAGPVRLTGAQAVAYVRSRQYTEVIDGELQTDPTGDLGRTERQRAFLTSLFAAVGAERSPLAAQRAAGALAPGLAIDDTMTFLNALGLVWDLRAGGAESVELPVYPYSTSGGASVVGLVEPDAAAVIKSFG